MNTIHIIQADISHTEILTKIGLQSFCEAFEKDNNPEDFTLYTDKAFHPEQIRKDIDEPGSIFYIAYINEEAVGYARIRESNEIQTHFPGQRLIELNRLYSLKKYIGKGIGKALMNCCLNAVKKKGFDIIWLGVWEHNRNAQEFYKKFGFKKFSSHIFLVGNDAQTDYLMKRSI